MIWTQKYIINQVHTIKVLTRFQYFKSGKFLVQSEQFCIVGISVQIFPRSKKRKMTSNERILFWTRFHTSYLHPRCRNGPDRQKTVLNSREHTNSVNYIQSRQRGRFEKFQQIEQGHGFLSLWTIRSISALSDKD